MDTKSSINMYNPDLSYLAPPDEVYQIKHSEEYKHCIKANNYHVRKIFYDGKRYSQYEEEKVDEFEREVSRLNIKLPQHWDRGKSLKYCLTGTMDLQKSIEALKKHLAWLDNPKMHTLSEISLSYL